MARKFLINNGELLMGSVGMHYELLDNKKDNCVSGGGHFHIDYKTNTVYFYGKSIDFGKVTQAEFDAAIKPDMIEDMKILFSHADNLADILPQNCNKT